MAESGAEREEGRAEEHVVTAQMKEKSGILKAKQREYIKITAKISTTVNISVTHSLMRLLMWNKRKLGGAQINKARYRTDDPK